jgi:plasmid maintenance system killer protein
VISRTRPNFWRLFSRLDQDAQKAAREAYQRFLTDPVHPSLHFKKLGGYSNVWSVRISKQYRAVGEREGDKIIWAWIGTHNDFDRMFG